MAKDNYDVLKGFDLIRDESLNDSDKASLREAVNSLAFEEVQQIIAIATSVARAGAQVRVINPNPVSGGVPPVRRQRSTKPGKDNK